jgi:hypothetical protein
MSEGKLEKPFDAVFTFKTIIHLVTIPLENTAMKITRKKNRIAFHQFVLTAYRYFL